MVDHRVIFRGTWVAQWVKAAAFGSGHDPRVLGWSPALGSLLSWVPDSLSLSASPPACALSLSFSNEQIISIKIIIIFPFKNHFIFFHFKTIFFI